MNLSIVIPQSPSELVDKVSTYHSPYFFPSVPKNINKKLFDWGDEYKIQELYDHIENLLTKFDNTFYKPYFPHNSRVLIKKELNKLYLLIKDNNSWLRSSIILNNKESDSKYYDYKYKNS
jgi:hypothetical protein